MAEREVGMFPTFEDIKEYCAKCPVIMDANSSGRFFLFCAVTSGCPCGASMRQCVF